MTNAYEPLKHGATRGRYRIGDHELTSGDLIEFIDRTTVQQGRVEYDGDRYVVIVADRHSLPLREIAKARLVSSGRL